ncbi:MAG: ATP-binding protein [Bacteroidota bacterium]|nr:ATP-binding protein [Bacteroidota bacterium]
MKGFTPKKLAFYTSILVTGAVLILLVIFNLFTGFHIFSSSIFIIVPVMFVISFYLYRYILEKFIYEKIKIIYKNIHNLKYQKGDPASYKNINLQTDIIHEVNEQVINWARDKKEEIEKLKSLEIYRKEFLGNVSHELKTPIFNIQGYVSTLLDGAIDDNEINREYLQKTEKNIDRMIAIIQDLEIISQLESGKLKLQFNQYDIGEQVKEVYEQLEKKAKSKNIKLVLSENHFDPFMVSADKERIHQVLVNLVDNSIKYGKEGGRTKVSLYDMDENLLVEVSDNGIGISQSDMPRLFERFFRADKSRSREQGGSGLGLAIVKHIIEAHFQTINVRSALGVGSTFSFTLKKA